MSKTWIITASTVAGLVLVAGTMSACHRHHGPGHMDPERMQRFVTWMVDEHLDEFEASDDQRKLVHEAKDRLFVQGKRIHDEHKKVREVFLTQLQQTNPDGDKLHALVDERIEAFRKLAHQGLDELLAIHATLTPEQLEKAKEMMQERLNKR